MSIILISFITFFSLFTVYMLVVTSSLGSERFKIAQYYMSSLTKSEEASVKINLLLDKYEAGLLRASIDKYVIRFIDIENEALAGEIHIANKYYSYGQLHRYGANGSNKWQCNKPDLKTFKRVIKLEKQLDPHEPVNVPSSKKTEEDVILD